MRTPLYPSPKNTRFRATHYIPVIQMVPMGFVVVLVELDQISDYPAVGGIDSSAPGDHQQRSEERRVGKECRSRWSPYH